MRWFFNFWRLARWPSMHDEHRRSHARCSDRRRFLFRQVWKVPRVSSRSMDIYLQCSQKVNSAAVSAEFLNQSGAAWWVSLLHRSTKLRHWIFGGGPNRLITKVYFFDNRWLSFTANGFHPLPNIYLAESFPVPVCRNIRIRQCKIYHDEYFMGHIASRKEYFYGMKVHALMT